MKVDYVITDSRSGLYIDGELKAAAHMAEIDVDTVLEAVGVEYEGRYVKLRGELPGLLSDLPESVEE